MKLPWDALNAPILTGAVVSLGLGVWLLAQADAGEVAAGCLLALGALLLGAALALWIRDRRD